MPHGNTRELKKYWILTFASCKSKSFCKDTCRATRSEKKSLVRRKRYLAAIVLVFLRHWFSAALLKQICKLVISDELFHFERFAVLPSKHQNQCKNNQCSCGIEFALQMKFKTAHFVFRLNSGWLIERKHWRFLWSSFRKAKNPYRHWWWVKSHVVTWYTCYDKNFGHK